jgi:DNA-directed RNA polymerase specialized sigma24 family protein
MIVYQQVATCRQPEAFLAWAIVILRRTAAGTWRHPRSAPLEVSQSMPQQEASWEPILPLATSDPGGDQELLRLLHDCLDTDEERAWALWIFFVGLKRREWELIFDVPLTRYDTLGQQVKRKLRRSPRVRLFLQHRLEP